MKRIHTLLQIMPCSFAAVASLAHYCTYIHSMHIICGMHCVIASEMLRTTRCATICITCTLYSTPSECSEKGKGKRRFLLAVSILLHILCVIIHV